MKGVIFDHSTILVDSRDTKLVAAVRVLLENLKAAGLRLIVFSTHPLDIYTATKARGLPAPDLFLSRQDVNANKGSPVWVQTAADRLGVGAWEMFYVGDDERDWRTAINAATLYLHASWVRPVPAGITTFEAPKPEMVWMFATHFLLRPPRWAYTLDHGEYGLLLRSLLGATVRLPSTAPGAFFTLQSVFTYKNKVRVGNDTARNLLMIHAVTSLYREGRITPNSLVAVYPSSQPNKISRVLQEFVQPVSRIFHNYFREDLLVRASAAVDTSMERWQAKKENREPRVSFVDQANTVHVNPKYENLIRGRTVIVFDDFTTTGMSLEWARNLLYAAGAEAVILVTVGKYPRPHTVYLPIKNEIVAPFGPRKYRPEMFKCVQMNMNYDPEASKHICRSFELWKEGKPYPTRVPAGP